MSELSEIENDLQLINVMIEIIPVSFSFRRSEIAMNELQYLYTKNCSQNQSSPAIEHEKSSTNQSISSRQTSKQIIALMGTNPILENDYKLIQQIKIALTLTSQNSE